MGARGANTFPSRNRLPYPFSLVVRPLFCLWFAGIPFLFRINMLVATLLIFAVATAGDSTGDVSTCCWSGLSESILALVCLSLGVFIALHILPVCIAFYVRFYFSASYSGLSGSLSVGWVFQEVKGPIPRL